MMKMKKVGAVAAAAIVGIVGCKSVMVSSTPSSATAKSQAELIGTTPAPVEVWMFQSKKVTVSKDGYDSKTVTIDGKLGFNAPDSVRVTLKRRFNVNSDPDGAEVLVNGESVGKTPLKDIGIDDQGGSTVEVRKKGWLKSSLKVKADSPKDLVLNMERDGSGRRLLELVPSQNGVTIKTTPIFSDTEVGENSPNVSAVKRVTSAPQNEYIQDISLLPDGKTMVVSILEEYVDGEKSAYRSNVWKMNTAIAGAPRSAITTGNFHDITPNASSDGKMLYFATTRNGRLSICRLNMERQSGITTVTQGNTADYSPALHPDTKDLLYAAVLPGSGNAAYLWETPVASRGLPSQLREGYEPRWSPDGKKLLYIKGDRDKNQSKIWICDRDGGNPTQLSMGTGEFNDVDANWSIDGKRIVFASNRSVIKDKKNYDIWMMDADGSNLTQLTTNGSCDDNPVFGPDGKTVYFRSNRGLVWDIWQLQIVENK